MRREKRREKRRDMRTNANEHTYVVYQVHVVLIENCVGCQQAGYYLHIDWKDIKKKQEKGINKYENFCEFKNIILNYIQYQIRKIDK